MQELLQPFELLVLLSFYIFYEERCDQTRKNEKLKDTFAKAKEEENLNIKEPGEE